MTQIGLFFAPTNGNSRPEITAAKIKRLLEIKGHTVSDVPIVDQIPMYPDSKLLGGKAQFPNGILLSVNPVNHLVGITTTAPANDVFQLTDQMGGSLAFVPTAIDDQGNSQSAWNLLTPDEKNQFERKAEKEFSLYKLVQEHLR